MGGRSAAAALVSLLLVGQAANAAPGDLDTTFGGGGIVLTNLRDDVAWQEPVARGVIELADGRIIAAGDSGGRLVVARYMADGSLDPTFGAGGRWLSSVGDSGRWVALAQQSDGALVIAGWEASDFALVRLAADGGLDPSFGNAGHVRIDLGSSSQALAAAVQPDDSLVVVGERFDAGIRQMLIARYTPDGSLDGSFGIGGVAVVALGANSMARAVAVQPDGRIVLAGFTSTSGGSRIALARLLPDGLLDASFGTGGTVVTTVGTSADASGIALQADGRIVVVGQTSGAGDTDAVVLRYDAAGGLDPTFGSGGVALVDRPVYDAAHAVQIAADGTIVASGTCSGPDGLDFALFALTPAGALDTSIAAGGVACTALGRYSDLAYALTASAGGGWVLAGSAGTTIGSSFALARYLAGGGLDAAFGDGGTRLTPIGPSLDYGQAVAIRPDGRIVLAGHSSDDDFNPQIGLAQYLPDGAPDTTFGAGGVALHDGGLGYEQASDLVIQDDGKSVVAGDGGGTFALMRFNADGSADADFGTDGTAAPMAGIATAVTQQPDGRLVAAGHADSGSTLRLARFERDGSLDPSFGIGGTVLTPVGTTATTVGGLARLSDGRLVVVGGTAQPPHGLRFVVARYHADGSLDASFDGDGVALAAIGASAIAEAVAVQADGTLVVAGHSAGLGATTDFAVIRLLADGSLDPTFGGEGTVSTDFAGRDDQATAVLPQADGHIVVTGFVTLPNGSVALGAARYRPDGTLDQGFGDGGRAVTAIPPYAVGQDAALAANDRLLIAGYASLAGGDEFLLARFDLGSRCADHAACDDGVFCNGVETCGDGICSAGAAPCALACDESARRCDGACPSIAGACRAAQRTRLTLQRHADPHRDRLQWSWLRGASTTIAELADPTTAAGYTACLYDGDGQLLPNGALPVPPGSEWDGLGESGYRYRDPDAATVGLRDLLVKGSDTNRAKVILRAGGAALPDVALPLALPLSVQLYNQRSGVCWGATFDAADVRRNDAGRFLATRR